MSGDLEGKFAFVTGGTRGIGLAVSETLASSGAVVVACGSTEASVSACQSFADRKELAIQSIRLDVENADQLRTTINDTAERLGGLDILVCCAGRAFRGSSLELTAQEWDQCLSLNLRAPFLTSQAALPHLIARGEGSIVFISSIWAVTATARRVAYIVAKSALTSLTRALAVDHAPDGVRVNAVAPGYVETDLLRKSLGEANPGRDVEQLVRDAAARHPLKRIGQPQDIADAVLFLAGPRSRFVTGQTLIVDGGLTTRFAMADFSGSR